MAIFWKVIKYKLKFRSYYGILYFCLYGAQTCFLQWRYYLISSIALSTVKILNLLLYYKPVFINQCYWESTCIYCTMTLSTLLKRILYKFWSNGMKPARLLCPWNFPCKNTGMGCNLASGIFLTQESNPHLLSHLHWQVVSLTLSHLGSPYLKHIYKAYLKT